MKVSAFILLLCCALLQTSALAWDAVGHRLTAAIALNELSPEKQEALRELLTQHPRYQLDFLEAMPSSVRMTNPSEQLQWLLGEAAYWPDIARRLPEADARRFNHPPWHYIDGSWARDAATTQGNIYVLQQPAAAEAGEPASSIRNESDVQNVVTALDYNTRVLADITRSMEERAVALCWVLHLMGDIHQPLHAGSLFSPNLFENGDRGGNAIDTDDGNLHARWDRALADSGVMTNLEMIQRDRGDYIDAINNSSADWSQWLAESRSVLLTEVYTDPMLAAIASADRQNTALPEQALDAAYIQNMQQISRQRLALAGFRIAIWLENTL